MVTAHSQSGPALTTVDGFPGSGKTHLARSLAAAITACHVEIDTFVRGDEGGYVSHLDRTRLAEHLQQHTARGELAVLDGLCIEHVIRGLGIGPCTRVYVMKMDRRGEWKDANLADSDRSVDDIVKGIEADIALGLEIMRSKYETAAVSPILREAVEYHREVRPHQMADIVFQWVEQ